MRRWREVERSARRRFGEECKIGQGLAWWKSKTRAGEEANGTHLDVRGELDRLADPSSIFVVLVRVGLR